MEAKNNPYILRKIKEFEILKKKIKRLEDIVKEKESLIKNIFFSKKEIKEKEIIIEQKINKIIDNKSIKRKKKILKASKKILKRTKHIRDLFHKKYIFYMWGDYRLHFFDGLSKKEDSYEMKKKKSFHYSLIFKKSIISVLKRDLEKKYFYKTNFFYIEQFLPIIKVSKNIIKEIREDKYIKDHYPDIIKELKKLIVFTEKFIERNLIFKEEVLIK